MKSKLSILSAIILSLVVAGSTFAQSTKQTPPGKDTMTSSKMSGKTTAKKTTKRHHRLKKNTAKK